MKLRNKIAAGVLGAGLLASTAACTPGGYPVSQSSYCVDSFGHVEPSYYCDNGGYYMGHHYLLFVGSTHSHVYHVGATIPRTYISSGKEISPSNTSARKAAGLPAKGKISNGVKATVPARPQTSPIKVGGSSTSKSTGTKSTFGSFSGRSTTTRPSSGFSTRSSFSSRSSFGRH